MLLAQVAIATHGKMDMTSEAGDVENAERISMETVIAAASPQCR